MCTTYSAGAVECGVCYVLGRGCVLVLQPWWSFLGPLGDLRVLQFLRNTQANVSHKAPVYSTSEYGSCTSVSLISRNRFPAVFTPGLWVCGSAGLQVCGSVGLWVCGSEGLRVCGSAGLLVCGSAGLRVCGSGGWGVHSHEHCHVRSTQGLSNII